MKGRSERLRAVGLGVVGFGALCALWEGYKAFGNAVHGHVFGWKLAGRTDDASMPHIATILRSFGKPEVRGTRTVLDAVVAGSWFTFRLAVGGFVIGVAVGLALAMVMQRFRFVERAWLPYVVLSQTVPLVALAPVVNGWGGTLKVFGHPWQTWMSVVAMSAYLTFFPVSIGALRGLQSPKAHSLELMDSYAASWWQTLTQLRFPSALPYLIPALKLAAAASIVGAIVAEISAGTGGGVGRLILDYFQKATGDPARVFTAFIGASALGLIVAALISVIELVVMRNRPTEALA
jgi:NitT/TauT family transport system permease protein